MAAPQSPWREKKRLIPATKKEQLQRPSRSLLRKWSASEKSVTTVRKAPPRFSCLINGIRRKHSITAEKKKANNAHVQNRKEANYAVQTPAQNGTSNLPKRLLGPRYRLQSLIPPAPPGSGCWPELTAGKRIDDRKNYHSGADKRH